MAPRDLLLQTKEKNTKTVLKHNKICEINRGGTNTKSLKEALPGHSF